MKRTNRIHVDLVHGETVITVTQWPAPESPYWIESSNVSDHPEGADWPLLLEEAIRDRRRERGRNKGRVLYAYQQRALHQGPLPVGALLFHLGDEAVRVTRAGTSRFKVGSDHEQIMTLLLACAQEIARLHGCPGLEWVVYEEKAARLATELYEFRRLKREEAQKRKLRGNEILLVRP